MARSFYWYDLETWGVDVRRDGPAQFAGVRTNEKLEVIEDPLVIYCKPPADALPRPGACMVTGITPQHADKHGVCEAEFAAQVHAEMARPQTCTLGYNTIRFDDEMMRNVFYRNFFDPYAREWQAGNLRWDLIDTMRLAYALRPHGINWPKAADGSASFRLELLSAANGIEHGDAHDALSDVYATIGLAKLLREKQPKLLNFSATLRNKQRAMHMLDLGKKNVVLHISEKIPSDKGCIAPVMPIAKHPINKNGVITIDLRHDPQGLIDLEAEEIHRRLFTAAADLKKGEERVALKVVYANRCQIVAPMSTLTTQAAERWDIDYRRIRARAKRVRAHADAIAKKMREVYLISNFPEVSDPDLMLYSGGFFSDADRAEIASVRKTPVRLLGSTDFKFEDARLPEMLFRYRARNFPETLNAVELCTWSRLCHLRVGSSLKQYQREVALMEPSSLKSDLTAWPATLF